MLWLHREPSSSDEVAACMYMYMKQCHGICCQWYGTTVPVPVPLSGNFLHVLRGRGLGMGEARRRAGALLWISRVEHHAYITCIGGYYRIMEHRPRNMDIVWRRSLEWQNETTHYGNKHMIG
jgi:hypothetical protein